MGLETDVSAKMISIKDDIIFMQIYLHVHMACNSQPETVLVKGTRNGMTTGIVTFVTATVMVDDTRYVLLDTAQLLILSCMFSSFIIFSSMLIMDNVAHLHLKIII